MKISEWLIQAINWIRVFKRLNDCEARLDALETRESNIKQEGPVTIKEIDYAHNLVCRVYKPEILNPKDQGNMDFMKEAAYQYIYILRARLIEQYIDSSPPVQLDVENKDSLAEWYKYLLELRAQFKAGPTVQISKVKKPPSKK